MSTINQFWDWMYSTVNNALGILNTMYINNEMNPYFKILIVVVATMVVIRFILMPIIGMTVGSDKAKKKEEDEK